MNERFIYLQELYFEGKLSPEEKTEFNSLLENDALLKDEFEEQKRIKVVLSKLQLKNPDVEIWDSYWEKYYNLSERGIAWILISIAAIIFIVYGAIKFINFALEDSNMPLLPKTAIIIGAIGGVILLVSVVREKWFTYRNDKYKEIQR